TAGQTDRLSLFGNVRFAKRMSLLVSGSHPLDGERTAARQLSLQLIYSAGAHVTASLSREMRAGAGTTVAPMQRSLPAGTGYAYRIEGPVVGANPVTTLLQYQGPYGRYEATFGTGSSHPKTVSVTGEVVAFGRRVYLTRATRQGVALLRLPGLG